MQRLIIAALMLWAGAACGEGRMAIFFGDSGVAWTPPTAAGFPSGWGYKVEITIDNTKIDSDLTDWTMVFDESFATSLFYAVNGPMDSDGTKASLSGGGDVRFSSDSNGINRIACDIRTWITGTDPTTGTCEVAVLVPSVSSSADTSIWMWWGKTGETQPAVDATYGQYAAYDDNHISVHPLTETGDGTTDEYKDRTSNQLHGTGTNSPDNVAGQVGEGGDFEETSTESISVQDPGNVFTADEITVEALMKPESWGDYVSTVPGYYGRIWAKGDVSTKTVGNLYIHTPGTPTGANGYLTFYARNVGTSMNAQYASSSDISMGAWRYVAGVYDGSVGRIYLDGVQKQQHTVTLTIPTVSDTVRIGNMKGYARHFDGVLDEVRLSNTARSAAWLKANNHNQMNTSGFLTWSSITDN